MFESVHAPLLPRRKFYARLRYHGLISAAVLAGCVALGMAGYAFLKAWAGWIPTPTPR